MSKVEDVVDRARTLPADDARMRGVVLYGSVAKGTAHELSDVDLVLVTEPGQREAVWSDRSVVASRLLGAEVEWAHELPWHGPYRYQAWRSDLLAVDLTIDEGVVEPHEVFPSGAPVVVAGDLSLPEVAREPAAADEPTETWVWLLGIHNQIRQGRVWAAYVQLISLLDVRLSARLDRSALSDLLPAAVDRPQLLEALAKCARAYDELTSARAAPLAEAILAVISSAATGPSEV